ncbi:MAG: hypothetical protein OHK0011_18100 [Turneriella sp.]
MLLMLTRVKRVWQRKPNEQLRRGIQSPQLNKRFRAAQATGRAITPGIAAAFFVWWCCAAGRETYSKIAPATGIGASLTKKPGQTEGVMDSSTPSVFDSVQ